MRSKYQRYIGRPAVILSMACLSSLPQVAGAQAMVEVPMLAVAQLGVNPNGNVERCGWEILGYDDTGKQTRIFDVSLYIYSAGHALGKLTGRSSPKGAPDSEMKPTDVHAGWIRVQGKQAAMPTSKFIDGESPKSKLYAADVRVAAETLYAIADGVTTQVSISWQPGQSTIYFSKPKVDASQSAQFLQCMDDLTRTIQNEMKGEPPKGK